jgi:hypothetical protein
MHELPYVMTFTILHKNVVTFTILHNNVVDANYLMLLSRPWLWDVKISHDWANDLVTIQGNGIIMTIDVTKHLGNDNKWQEVLMCYGF